VSHKEGGHAVKTIGLVFDMLDVGVSHKSRMVAELVAYIQEARHFGPQLFWILLYNLAFEMKLPKQLLVVSFKGWLQA
jgi:hypothetical protein